jgi:hypothetical protein
MRRNASGGAAAKPPASLNDRTVTVPKWVAIALAVAAAGWMFFDGVRALTAGDYVTVDGELGPWADLVEAVGIDPRATGMKAFFAVYGAAWLFAAGAYAGDLPRSRAIMAGFALGSLWYLALGTVSSVVQLVLLTLDRRLRPV